MRKILLIHRSLGLGGAEKIFAFLANTLSEKYKVKILLLTDEVPTLFLSKAIEVEVENCYMDKPILSKEIWLGLKELKHMSDMILNQIKGYKPELIICFDLRIFLALMLVKNKCSTKILFSERADPFDNPKYWTWILKLLYRRVDYIVFQTDQARDFYGEIVKNKSCVIANPAFSRISLDVIHETKKRNNLIFAAGRFQKRKGFDLLIEAFAYVAKEFPECNLVIYGSGEEHGNLEDLIKKYKLTERIELCAPVNGVVEQNRMARLFVLPSRSEGIPNILIEAMIEGIPCVTTDCSPGGARMLSENGKYCMLAKNDDVESLTKQLYSALRKPFEMEKMAKGAQKSMNRFDTNIIGEEWLNIVNKIIIQNRSDFDEY